MTEKKFVYILISDVVNVGVEIEVHETLEGAKNELKTVLESWIIDDLKYLNNGDKSLLEKEIYWQKKNVNVSYKENWLTIQEKIIITNSGETL